MQEIKTITIQDGSTRFSKTITEQEQVLELLTLIQDIKMTWKNNQEKHGSWHYPIKEDS